MVLLTVFFLYSGFGIFNLFAYGDYISDKPLITQALEKGVAVYIIKIAFAINVIFTYTLMIFPATIIFEEYLFKNWQKSRKRQWMKNLSRSITVLFTLVVCYLLGNKLDKFLSLIGTLASTPVAFTLPCMFHLAINKPDRNGKIIDYGIIVLSIIILIFCSGFNIWTWND